MKRNAGNEIRVRALSTIDARTRKRCDINRNLIFGKQSLPRQIFGKPKMPVNSRESFMTAATTLTVISMLMLFQKNGISQGVVMMKHWHRPAPRTHTEQQTEHLLHDGVF